MSEDAVARTARVLHLALVASSILVVVVFTLLSPAPPEHEGTREALLYGGFVLGAICCIVAVRLLARLRPPAGDREAWWLGSLSLVLVAWALLEAAAIVGGVTRFLTGEWAALVVCWAAVILLVFHAPGRIAGR